MSKKIGELLIENDLISRAQLAEVLASQKKSNGVLLGELLIQAGFIEIAVFIKILELQLMHNFNSQNIASEEGMRRNCVRLGDMMVDWGILSEQQLKEALDIQSKRVKDTLLGEVIIERGYATVGEIMAFLEMQLKEKSYF